MYEKLYKLALYTLFAKRAPVRTGSIRHQEECRGDRFISSFGVLAC